MSLGILFPGQGSQKVGMLEEFISKYPIVSQTFEEASDILSTNLLKIIKKGPVEKRRGEKTQFFLLVIVLENTQRFWLHLFLHLKMELS